MTYSDRSRAEEYRRCPRARWWAYEWGRGGPSPAGGVSRLALSIPLSTGLHVHAGVAYLLHLAGRTWTELPDTELLALVEEAVHLAVTAYKSEVERRGLHVEAGGDAAYTAAEQIALTEALLRAWACWRLPQLCAEYKVLEVERELELPFSSSVVWQSRADALLSHRDNQDLYVYSLKTQAWWDRRREAECHHDVQGLSEAAAVEHALAQELAQLHEYRGNLAAKIAWLLGQSDWEACDKSYADLIRVRHQIAAHSTQVEGVLMDFLLKGERQQDKDDSGQYSGPYLQRSPLIRAWRKEVIDTSTLQVHWRYAWAYYWPCPRVPHDCDWREHKTPCRGDKSQHGLGNSWAPFNVWEHPKPFEFPDLGWSTKRGGVAGWIEALAAGAVQSQVGQVWDTVFVSPEPYRRNKQDLEDWREQEEEQEWQIAELAARARSLSEPVVLRSALNAWFPQTKRACDWPVTCPFQELCYGTLHAGEVDPLALGIYTPRVPHHQPELFSIQSSPQPSVEPVLIPESK